MERLPVLPLGQLVVYPHVVLPLSISDPRAVQLLDVVVQGDKRLLLGVVKPSDNRDPPEGPVMDAKPEDLYAVGTATHIHKMFKRARPGMVARIGRMADGDDSPASLTRSPDDIMQCGD